MTAPRPLERRHPPSPPGRLSPRRGGRSSPHTYAVSAAGRPTGFACPRVARRSLIGSARALAAGALFALSGAPALLLSPAQAQESETLVSNVGQGSGDLIVVGDKEYAQGFTTGSYVGGHRLSSIDIGLSSVPFTPAEVTVELWSATSDPTPEPDALVATLTHSTGTWARGLNTFNAPAGTELVSYTTYFVFVSDSSGGDFLLISTGSSSTDGGGASEWSVGNALARGRVAQDSWRIHSHRIKFNVNGKALGDQPSEIRAYWTDDPENPKGSNEQVDCASAEPFRAYWNPPKSGGSFKRADEWEAEITTKYGASNVSFTIQNTGGDRKEPELTGTVRIRDGEFGSLSMRVRGRFGDDGWGAWSPRTGLYCWPSSAERALQGRFVSPPERHDGKKRIKVQVAFSEPVEESPEDVGEHGVEVEGGEVTSVSPVGGDAPDGAGTHSVGGRNAGREDREVVWEFEIEPDSDGDLTISLDAGRPCGEPGAICTADGRSLSQGISTTVEGPDTGPPPLTASFEDMPEAHDGEGGFRFRVAFSEDIGISFRNLREDAFTVSSGRVTGGKRVDGRRDLFEMTVRPTSVGDVTITLLAGRACAVSGAICTKGEPRRKLTNTISATVGGPVSVSVADARAEEGTDETIDFAVTLSRASSATVAVAYATADSSATAGSDYTARKGELTFDPGETGKTVRVPVLDDAVDEGEETFTLRLVNAPGARIADGTATGTIENSDPLQKMWLSRFGRTVAGQVVDAVAGRLSGPAPGSQVTLGGQSIDLSSLSAGTGDVRRTLAGALGAQRGANDDGPLAGPGPLEAAQAGSWDDPETGGTVHGLTGRELLLGSSFHLAAGGGETGGPGYAAWGRMAVGGFDAKAPAEKGTVRLDGEVTTGLFGADAQGERWLAGLALSVSSAEGSFDQPGVDSGTVESTLTSVSPYVRYRASDRLSAWGLLGYGAGDMTMTQAANDNRGAIVTRTDLSMRLGAAGARGVLLEADESGGIDLALRGDAFLVQMESEKAANTVATKADASRLRLVLEAGRSFGLRSGAVLAPALELGLRHDGGDAETGAGVELGGRIRFADAGSGLTVEANARTLVAHEDAGYREWGAGGSLRLDPGASGRGLSLALAPVWGTPSSGVERLWSARDAAGLAPGGEFEAERRLEGELGYGFGAFGGRGRVTPYAGLGLAEAGDRTWRAGARWSLAPTLAMSLDGMRREPANDDAPEHGVQFGFTLRW